VVDAVDVVDAVARQVQKTGNISFHISVLLYSLVVVDVLVVVA
jgi:hypothetical protein